MSTAEWPRPSERAVPPRAKASSRTGRKRDLARLAEMRGLAADQSVGPPSVPMPLAGFVVMEVQPVEAEKWPVNPVIWWYPDLPVEVPRCSGLRNERRHKTPIPGFLELEELLQCEQGVPAVPGVRFPPEAPRILPASELKPLGWDPRILSVYGKVNGQPLREGETK